MAKFAATLDFGAFSTSEKQALLTAAKAEVLTRVTGRVQNGSSSAQSFGMTLMTMEDLTLLINALTVELGFQQPEIRVAPNFNGCQPYGYTAACAVQSPSRLEPDVHSWADLQALSTTGYPDYTIKIWVDSDTGVTVTARLVPSTQATDSTIGAYRPNDYADPGNARVWFQAAN
jgi:hypothetical protein